MALKMNKSGGASPVYRHLPDYVVLSGGGTIGRIYKEIGSPPEYGWSRALGLNGQSARAPMACRACKRRRRSRRRRGTNGRRGRGWTRLAERISGFQA
jgi:hypothetical protein